MGLLGYFIAIFFIFTIQAQNLPQRYEELVGKVTSDAFIDEQIKNGEAYAQRYTDSEFLNRIVNADKLREKDQITFNKRLIIDGTDYSIPIGIYIIDLMNMAHLGSIWTLEWFLYTRIVHAFTASTMYDLLVTPNETTLYQSSRIGGLSKRLISSVVFYSLANALCEHSKEHLLLDATNRELSPSRPMYAVIKNKLDAFSVSTFSPHVISKKMRAFFKKFGLTSEWTERFEVEVTKESITLLLWLTWYKQYKIDPLIKQHLESEESPMRIMVDHIKKLSSQQSLTVQEKLEITELTHALTYCISQMVMMPFMRWVVYKTTSISTWHGAANLLVATPAWYKLAKLAYNTCHQVPLTPDTITENSI